MIVGISWCGILQGCNADPAKDVPSARVATGIVDPILLNRHAVAVERTTDLLGKICVAIDGGSDQPDDLAKEMSKLSRLNTRVRSLSPPPFLPTSLPEISMADRCLFSDISVV